MIIISIHQVILVKLGKTACLFGLTLLQENGKFIYNFRKI